MEHNESVFRCSIKVCTKIKGLPMCKNLPLPLKKKTKTNNPTCTCSSCFFPPIILLHVFCITEQQGNLTLLTHCYSGGLYRDSLCKRFEHAADTGTLTSLDLTVCQPRFESSNRYLRSMSKSIKKLRLVACEEHQQDKPLREVDQQ